MSNDKNLLKLNELYAVGPSISVLMEGYKDKKGNNKFTWYFSSRKKLK